MSGVVAIGEAAAVRDFALAGVTVEVATDAASATAAWERLPEDTGLVILSPAAMTALRGRLEERPHLLWAVTAG